MHADSNALPQDVKLAHALVELHRAYTLALATGASAGDLRAIFTPTPRPGEDYLVTATRGWLTASVALLRVLDPTKHYDDLSECTVQAGVEAMRQHARGGVP